MDHYAAFRPLNNPEIQPEDILGRFVQALHHVRTQEPDLRVALSFPQARAGTERRQPWIGRELRLHGTKGDLDKFLQQQEIKSLDNYGKFSDIQPVPETEEYRIVRRVQTKSGPERLRRRAEKRLAERKRTADRPAPEKLSDMLGEFTNLPFLRLSSKSTGQSFRLFVDQGEREKTPSQGRITSYGLSSREKPQSVPWFP